MKRISLKFQHFSSEFIQQEESGKKFSGNMRTVDELSTSFYVGKKAKLSAKMKWKKVFFVGGLK